MSCTLAQVRQLIAVELGGEGVGGFLSSSVTSGTTGSLVDSAWPANSNLSVADQWQDAWILRPNAALASDRVRLVSSYTPNGGNFIPDLNWTNAPTAAEAYEIHSTLEPNVAMQRCINEALKRCMIETEIAYNPVFRQIQDPLVTLTNATWLSNRSWVRQGGWLGGNEDRLQIWPYERPIRGEVLEVAGNVVATHPSEVFTPPAASTNTAGQILFARVMMPAYFGVKASASHSYGTPTSITTNGIYWTVNVASTVGMTHLDTVTLSGFTPTAYNGSFTISAVTSPTQFLISATPQPGTPSVMGTTSSTTTQSGVLLDTDIIPCKLEWVAWAAIVEAWRHYGMALDTAARARLIPTRGEAAAMFTTLNRDNSKWPVKTWIPLMVGGPVNYSTGMPRAYRASTA